MALKGNTVSELKINPNPSPGEVRWRVGNRTLDEIIATMLDLPKDRLATTTMLHSWRQLWREKNPSPSRRKGRINPAQTRTDLLAGEEVGAFRRVANGSSEVWRLVPDVLGLNQKAPAPAPAPVAEVADVAEEADEAETAEEAAEV